jgi:type I restriction enzyme S subunit
MPNHWPLVPLGELLTPVSRPDTVNAEKTYRILGAHWYAQGLYTKDVTPGAGVRAKALYRVEQGDFVYNRLFAWKGSFAVANKENHGCYVSNEFPCFTVNASRLGGQFLWRYFSRSSVWDEALAESTGGTPTSRNRLKEGKFLAFKIPLPPLEEQRRIVARIEQLAAKIQEARGLRQDSKERANKVLAEEELAIWSDQALEKARTLAEVTTFLARGRQSQQGPSDHYLIKTQHVQLGLYLPTQLTLAPSAAAKVNPESEARRGDVLIACSAAGCLGRVALYRVAGVRASTDTHVAIARANRDAVLPEYLYAYLKGAQGQRQLRSREKGDWLREKVGFRLTELNVADMRRVPVPTPPLAEQRRIVTYLDNLQAKVDALKRLQAETAAELNALLPSILDRAFRGEL